MYNLDKDISTINESNKSNGYIIVSKKSNYLLYWSKISIFVWDYQQSRLLFVSDWDGLLEWLSLANTFWIFFLREGSRLLWFFPVVTVLLSQNLCRISVAAYYCPFVVAYVTCRTTEPHYTF